MPNVAEWVCHLEAFAPLATAASWDNVGLLLGDHGSRCDRAMTCLTITNDVVEEAVDERVELIVAHHPILFKGAKNLSDGTTEGRLLQPLMRAGIAVYSPHTAFDNCPGGINDGLAARFGLQNVRPLRSKDSAPDYKLVAFVPKADLIAVSDAVFAAGGGVLGGYEQCSFRSPGKGTFFGTAGTNPTIGQRGHREVVPELRVEFLVPESKLIAAVAGLRNAHSYEEPAFDLYPLKPKRGTAGEGRIGELGADMPLREFAALVKHACRASAIQFVGASDRPVKIVALACGAAGEYLQDALRMEADAFVTGEARFHDLLTAEAAGIVLVLPGHYASERPGVEDLAERLKKAFPSAEVWASRYERDPLTSL